MPISKQDILDILGDPTLRNIRFSVGPINVNSDEYGRVADYIASGLITVTPGKGSVAMYYPQINTLKTRRGDPPLELDARSNVVHECTHIISDANRCAVTRLVDEAAAYLAQTAYHLLLDPSMTTLMGDPLGDMIVRCMKMVEQYRLGEPEGLDARISDADVQSLAQMVHAIPDYANISEKARLDADGVAVPDKFVFEGVYEGVVRDLHDFYRLQLFRSVDQNFEDLATADAEQLITTDVQGVAHENYITDDPELLGLMDAYRHGGAARKTTTLQKLLNIFLNIDQRSATSLLQRLSALRKGDHLSERFQKAFSAQERSRLLAGLKLTR